MDRHCTWRGLTFLTIATVVASCRSADVPPDTGVIPAPTASITLEEDLRLGTDEPLFANVGDVVADMDGNTYVAERREPTTIHKYDRSGSYSGAVGATGEGPGEYDRLTDVMAPGDSLVVWDAGPDRFIVYDSDGSYRWSSGTITTDNPTSIDILGAYGGGYLARETPVFRTGGMTMDDIGDVILRTLDRRGRLGDVIWTSEMSEYLMFSDENRVGIMQRPFGRETLCTAVLARFYCAWSESLELHGFTASGDTLPPVRIAYMPIAVTAAERQAATEGVPEYLADQLTVPETRPALDGLTGDDRGRLWLKVRLDRDDDVTNYWIVDPADQSIVSVRIDDAVELGSVRDGNAYGVLTSTEGESFVVRYRIVE